MLVVTRYRVGGEADAGDGAVGADFLARAGAALQVLAERPGFRSGRIGRAADDPSSWVMTTEWEHVGAYRRALSAYEVKVHAVPLLSLAADEPTAYEVLVAVGVGAEPGGTARASDRAPDVGRRVP